MRIASNKLGDIIKYFREELQSLYAPSEITAITDNCLEEFASVRYSTAIMEPERTVSESILLKFSFAVKDLRKHVPLQYILGYAWFFNRKFAVGPEVLVPRPETEELVALMISELRGSEKLSILDIGTGSGCIAVSLAAELPGASITAMDISEGALALAGKNASQNNVMIDCQQADILSDNISLEKFNVIVSNPPYICRSESNQMSENVLAFEPHIALFVPDNDPLLFYRKIASHVAKDCRPGTRIYFELNQAFGEETLALLSSLGFEELRLVRDINGKNRILRGTLSGRL
jgi:release factor glutamine methyltransferase